MSKLKIEFEQIIKIGFVPIVETYYNDKLVNTQTGEPIDAGVTLDEFEEIMKSFKGVEFDTFKNKDEKESKKSSFQKRMEEMMAKQKENQK